MRFYDSSRPHCFYLEKLARARHRNLDFGPLHHPILEKKGWLFMVFHNYFKLFHFFSLKYFLHLISFESPGAGNFSCFLASFAALLRLDLHQDFLFLAAHVQTS